VNPGSLGRLRIAHCTVLPDPDQNSDPPLAAVVVDAGGTDSQRHTSLRVEIERSSCGPVSVTEFAPSVSITESIVRGERAASGQSLPALEAAHAVVEHSTLLGDADLRSIEASGSIFRDPVTARRRQEGCVRYSYVAPGSTVPRRFRCHPADAADASAAARVVPGFVSTDPGDPGYAQLAPGAPEEIALGAEDGDEMGAFHFTHGGQRIAHLRTRLDEYLRLGLEAGFFFVT
jgi:hypothetical protein